jgi:hypothetical protein
MKQAQKKLQMEKMLNKLWRSKTTNTIISQTFSTKEIG